MFEFLYFQIRGVQVCFSGGGKRARLRSRYVMFSLLGVKERVGKSGMREGYRCSGWPCERAALIGVRSVRLSSRHAPAFAVQLA